MQDFETVYAKAIAETEAAKPVKPEYLNKDELAGWEIDELREYMTERDNWQIATIARLKGIREAYGKPLD